MSDAGRARDVLDLRVVEGDPPQATPRALMTAVFGISRRPSPAASVVVFERATGRAVAAVPVEGGVAEAHGLLHVMRADLDRDDVRRFLRRWGGPRPR